MSFDLRKIRWVKLDDIFNSNNYLRVDNMRRSQKTQKSQLQFQQKFCPIMPGLLAKVEKLQVKDVKLSRQTVLYIKLSIIIKDLSFVVDFHFIYSIIRQDMRTIHQNGLEVQHNCTQQKRWEKIQNNNWGCVCVGLRGHKKITAISWDFIFTQKIDCTIFKTGGFEFDFSNQNGISQLIWISS